MVMLGVNIDHVATVRQARLGREPDPDAAAALAECAGADGITVHLREDRRHIQDRDVIELRRKSGRRLNLEMSVAEGIVRFALRVRPDEACIVPERRQELTTEGGLDVAGNLKKVRSVVKRLRARGIVVSLFINPESSQVRAASSAGAQFVELHTGRYAGAKSAATRKRELNNLRKAGALAVKLGLGLNAGHGLDYCNVVPVARIPKMHTLNIGHSVIARAVYTGLPRAVREMKEIIRGVSL